MTEDDLVVDAGHTRIKFAHCRSIPDDPLPRVLNTTAAIDDAPVNWTDIMGWFRDGPPRTSLVTGTNLTKARALLAQWPPVLPAPVLLTDKSLVPIQTAVDFPERVGIDRLLNAVAANAVRERQQPAIVVDTGTAVTVDVIDADGIFQGGAILPGIRLGAQSLHAYTTTLPLIDIWPLLEQSPEPVGRNTEAAIASGLYWGHLGGIKELVSRSHDALSAKGVEPLLLVTGGAAVILTPYLSEARYEPALSLQGLALTSRSL